MEASAAEAAVAACSGLNLFQHAASASVSEEEKENDSDSNRNKTEIFNQFLKSNHWSSVITSGHSHSSGSVSTVINKFDPIWTSLDKSDPI